jgi:hypothetical protein
MRDTTDTDGLEKMILQDLQRDYKKIVKLRLTVLHRGYEFYEDKIALVTPNLGNNNTRLYLWIHDECIWVSKRNWTSPYRSLVETATVMVELARPNYKETIKRKLLLRVWNFVTLAIAKEEMRRENSDWPAPLRLKKLEESEKELAPLRALVVKIEPEMDELPARPSPKKVRVR